MKNGQPSGAPKKLPVNELKIDKSFVIDMLDKPDDLAIVKTTIEMAHNLGLTVIAEGVEELAQKQLLESMHVDGIQGYLIARPAPLSKIVS